VPALRRVRRCDGALLPRARGQPRARAFLKRVRPL
jgi:hypothetical protein